MFHSRKSHTDIKKNTHKFLDHKKETTGRLKALRLLLDVFDNAESKVFLEGHYCEIYFVFYDVFSIVETNLKQKGHKSQREDLDAVLYILEKILRLLPELIQRRWQFHSIGRIMLKLLHHGNTVKLRREGVRLFLLWFQCLQGNSDELSQLMYASIIPGFPNPIDSINWEKSTLSRTDAEDIVYVIRGPEYEDQASHASQSTFHLADKNGEDWCNREEIQPIYPLAANEKSPSVEKLTKFFLDKVLESMSTGIVLTEWTNKRCFDLSFSFIFNNFNKYYLPYIFSDWRPKPPLYEAHPEIKIPVPTVTPQDMSKDCRMSGPRESILRWFVAFTVRFKRQNTDVPENPFMSTRSIESQLSSSPTSSPGSIANVDLLRTGSTNNEHLYDASDVIRRVLYSTKENVQLLHEVLRQGFRLPPRNVTTIRQVLLVYQDWIKLNQSEKPIFMLEPSYPLDALDAQRSVTPYNDEDHLCPSSPVRSWSYCHAVDKKVDDKFVLPTEEVRAGIQANLRLFLLHSAEVFLVPEDKEVLAKQVDVCKRVIHLYRNIVLEVAMETKTWEQLLLVLLGAAQHLLSREVPLQKEQTLCGQLAGSLLQTLFVTWIRANLKVQVSVTLWDECMDVLSSLTHWEEVITEWNSTLQTLTRVMARTVYALDLEDLPLVRLSEQKRKKRRHQLENKSQNFTKDSFARFSKMETHSSTNSKRADKTSGGSPKLLRDIPDKSVGMSSAPVTPNAQRPNVDATVPRIYTPEGEKKMLLLGPPGQSAFKRTQQKLSNDESWREKSSAETIAGPATRKEDESAGQIQPSNNLIHDIDSKILIDTNRDSPLPNKLILFQASDTESIGSGELSFRPDVEDVVSDMKDDDKIDFASTPPLLRQTSDASTISTQDNTKSMEWYNLSFDKEPGGSTPPIIINNTLGLSRISESSLECKSDPSSRDSLVDSNTGPAGFGQDEVKSRTTSDDSESDTKESRLSTLLTGQEISDVLGQRYRSPTPPLTENHEGLLELDESEGGMSEEDQCVIAGGMREGWGPISSVVLWRRMLGILGNINKINDSTIHANVIECLATVWNMLAKVRLNQGISIDNKITPQIPELLPPLQFFATWVFEAASLSMPYKFKEGRLLAYQLMTAMTVRRHKLPLSQEYLTHFYRLMHIGLTGTDQDVISAIISNCGHFFSLTLPCCTLLILDFIQAANTIFINQNLELPRAEAVTLMGSLLSYPNAFPNMPLHQPGHQTNEYQPTSTCKDIKEKLVVALLRVAKLDPSSNARCIALNSLGLFVVEELVHCKGHPRIQDCICVLLQSITFYHKAISSIAVDLIHLLSEYYKELSAYEYDLPLKIVEVLCHTLVSVLPGGEAARVQEDNSVVIPLILCLLEWSIAIPVERLLMKKGDENLSILSRVFQVLQLAAINEHNQKRRKSLNISTIISGDGRPIRLARVQEQSKSTSLSHSPFDIPDSGEDVLEDNKMSGHFTFPPKEQPIKLIAKAAMMHLVNNLGHFPLGAGPSRLDSFVGEHEDNFSIEADELLPSIFNSPNVQFFSLNDSVLVTLIELQQEVPSQRSVLQDMTTAKTQVRLILRDMTGRHCWDYTLLYGKNDESGTITSFPGHLQGTAAQVQQQVSNESKKKVSRKRMLRELRVDSTPIAPDRLDEALSYIGATSCECILYPDQSLNEPAPSSHVISQDMESSVIECVSNQFEAQLNYLSDVTDNSLSASRFRPVSHADPSSPFQLCRFLISEHGIMAWEKRTRVDLLNRNERFLRELKNLDTRRCRDTHKIAVLYVAQGQEDKTSIMKNNAGSRAYEDFVAGLGWEVDLSKHTGFMGGLERNLSTGETAPYHATSTEEVIFHVSTRMPLATDGTGFTKKMRHLGNDGVHIVWSEHNRDYRYGIVNTEFGDVLIVIYPLKNHLFRIHVIKKPEVPNFGPLFDGAIVNRRVLPFLVRATAINASKAGRSLMPLYERCYEERFDSIQTIVQNHKHMACFEEFASSCFSPAPNMNSRPSTPPVEPKALVRTQAAASGLIEQDSPNRSKSTGTSLIGQNSELGTVNANVSANEDLSAIAMSLPDELNRVNTGESITVRQEKRRLSLRWRNKSSSSVLNEITTDASMYAEGLNGEH